MLPRPSELGRVQGGQFIPSYLGEGDRAWLESLLDHYRRLVGQSRRVVREHLRVPPEVRAPRAKLRLATHVLSRQSRDQVDAPVEPRRLRQLVFELAAQGLGRNQALDRAAQAFGISSAAVEKALFADLSAERVFRGTALNWGPDELAGACNATLVELLLGRAVRVVVATRDGVAGLLRAARRAGLVCVARSSQLPETGVLEVSGPYALFRHTGLYRRALVSVLPWIARCRHFVLRADCVLDRAGLVATLVLRPGDPIRWQPAQDPGQDPVLLRLTRDWGRLGSDWELRPDPGPIEAAGVVYLPDAQLVQRTAAGNHWLVEIERFWTVASLEHKLALARSSGIRLLLCVEAGKNCGPGEVPNLPAVIAFHRRIDPALLLSALSHP